MARPAPAAAKALKIIDVLAAHRDQQFTISDLAQRTQMSLGSAHAILAVLEEAGYLSRHPARRTYGLGPALVSAGMAALEQHPAIRFAAEQIPALAAELEADVVVTAATPGYIVFVATGGQRSRYGTGFREGERVPLVPPFGLVFLAWSQWQEVAAWLARGPVAPDPAEVKRGLAIVRERGYALGQPASVRDPLPGNVPLRDSYHLPVVELDQRYNLGMASAPVFNADGRVLVAITASGFPPGLTGRQVLDIGERVKACATVVTKQAKGRFPGHDHSPGNSAL